MISLTVEQFEYIYCGDKIREAAGHLSFNCAQPWSYSKIKPWIFSQGLGSFFKNWTWPFTYVSDCYLVAYVVSIKSGNPTPNFWDDFRFWDGHSFDSFVTPVPRDQADIGEVHAP